ncbi:hypothetical protein ACVIIW_000448 [Bradyrhizobium sp. USDA 4449]
MSPIPGSSLRGDRTSSRIAAGDAVDAAASAREVRAGRVVPVSPKPRADERRCDVRLANILAARVHTAARPCGIRRARVRQNRVVPAVVATVKPVAEVQGAQPGEVHRQFAGRGRPEGIRLPGEHGISRQPIAQGRPSDRHHLYAAVRSFPALHLAQRTAGARSAPGLPCTLLDEEGGVTKQSSGEMSRESA